MSVLHVVEEPGVVSDAGEADLLAAAGAGAGGGGSVCLIGSERGERIAAEIGVRVDARVPVVAGGRLLGPSWARALGRHVSRLESERVVAWGPGAARGCAELGLPVDGRGPSLTAEAEPGRELFDRDAVRRSMHIDRDSLVLAPLADPARLIDARSFVFLSGVLELMDRRVVVLVPETAGRVAQAARFMRTSGVSLRLLMTSGSWCRAVAGADLGIVDWEDIDAGDGGDAAGGRLARTRTLVAHAEAHGVRVCRGALTPEGLSFEMRRTIGEAVAAVDAGAAALFVR